MTTLTFYASRPHYADHLAPIWLAFPDHLRGPFRAPLDLHAHIRSLGVTDVAADDIVAPSSAVAVVASYKDYDLYTRGSVVLVEHGVGQVHGSKESANPGGPGRDRVILFLCPNDHVAAANRLAYPSTPAAVVGMPSMDSWPTSPSAEPAIPTILFHWNWATYPTARWAFPTHRAALRHLPSLLNSPVIGHGHPRAYRKLYKWYLAHGYTPVPSLPDVAAQASWALADNTSAAFQLMALGIPVGWLQAASYPGPEANLPPRFYPPAFRLPVLNPGEPLLPFVEIVAADLPEHREAREELVAQWLPLHGDGKAGWRAAGAIQDVLAERG